MKSRPLGDTGYRVSEVGFGAWGIGGEMWRGVDDSEGRKALREAVEQGITFFDTALAYGNGHSERVIGETLKDEIRGNRAVVATKIPPMNREWPGKASYKLGDVFPANYIASSTEQSLKNLRMEALHVQQLHVWNDAWFSDPEWEASYRQIVRLKEEGKVLHWGISINDHAPETALRILADPLFETAQVIYNIYDRSPEKALFALARQKPLGIIVRVPFDESALTGKLSTSTRWEEGDFRNNYFAGDRLERTVKRVAKVKETIGSSEKDMPTAALKFALKPSAVSTVIPGIRNVRQAELNCAVSDMPSMSDELEQKLRAHNWRRAFWYAGK